MKRIFVPVENISDKIITIKGSDVHHLKNVLRKKAKDRLDICSGGFSFVCEIKEISNKSIKLTILEKSKINEDTNIRIRLFQAIPKGKILEEIMRKATELGVYEFIPIITERGSVKYSSEEGEKKLDRWQKIISETSKKTGIHSQMKIKSPIKISQIPGHIPDKNETKLVFWESETTNSLKDVLSGVKKELPLNIIIGPEGGFSIKEINMLKDWKFESVSLGKRIYTVETATIVAISNILFYFESQ
ncbi:MAG: RsmE family RNA methyltransferase [Brevinematia bacterium]